MSKDIIFDYSKVLSFVTEQEIKNKKKKTLKIQH